MMRVCCLIKSGLFSAVLKKQSPHRLLAVLQTRAESTTPAQAGAAVPAQVEIWRKANDRFYGPERDYVNFPHPTQPAQSGKCRLGFIPEEFFQFFYPKTGVTGPYLFGGGLVAYVLSKEIWVLDHGFSEVIGFWGAFGFLVWKVGPHLKKFLDNTLQRWEDHCYNTPMAKETKTLEKTIEDAEVEIWRQDGQQYLFQAKKENIDLQLEAVYRKRLQDIYNQVKRRLDYQLEIQTTKRQFEQRHMVSWIVDSVVKGITPQQEKDSIARCIQDLNSLAKA